MGFTGVVFDILEGRSCGRSFTDMGGGAGAKIDLFFFFGRGEGGGRAGFRAKSRLYPHLLASSMMSCNILFQVLCRVRHQPEIVWPHQTAELSRLLILEIKRSPISFAFNLSSTTDRSCMAIVCHNFWASVLPCLRHRLKTKTESTHSMVALSWSSDISLIRADISHPWTLWPSISFATMSGSSIVKDCLDVQAGQKHRWTYHTSMFHHGISVFLPHPVFLEQVG